MHILRKPSEAKHSREQKGKHAQQDNNGDETSPFLIIALHRTVNEDNVVVG
jgi:hypothetical protein